MNADRRKWPGTTLLTAFLCVPLWLPLPVQAQTGTVKAEGQPIPGATVKAIQPDKTLTTFTDTAGHFTINGLTPGEWVVEVEMFGFEISRKQVQVGANPVKLDFTLELRDPNARFGAGRATTAVAQGANEVESQVTQALNAPPPEPAAAPENANESFLVNGSLSRGLQQTDFGGPGFPGGPGGMDREEIRQRMQQGGGPRGPGGGGPGGGFAGPGGGFRGPGGGFAGRGGGGFGGPRGRGRGGRPGGPNGAFIGNARNRGRDNTIHGGLFYIFGNSALNAKPYSLSGQAVPQPAYAQNRIGFTLGGPLIIPKVVDSDKTFFFVNYFGNLNRNPFSAVATVPSPLERQGDFSGLGTLLYDPMTHAPFANNQIPLTRIDPIALGLLGYLPNPNLPGAVQNFQNYTSVPQNAQNVNVRFNQTLSNSNRVALGFGTQSRSGQGQQTYGFRDETSGSGINTNLNWTHNFGRGTFNVISAMFNRNRSTTVPYFAYGADVALALGIAGTATDSINYGPPNLNFTNYGALTDASPSLARVQTMGVSDSFSVSRGGHNMSFGASFRRLHVDTTTDQNGRGTFTFTGLATSALDANGQPVAGTGWDFADFLLGLPQSSSVRFGSSSTYFRGNQLSFFGNDDWRVHRNFTVNFGLRWEYYSPLSEKYGHIANLDIAPGFTAVAPVTPGEVAPYSGALPDSLVRPDKNNFAPRIGIAWKPINGKSLEVRAGYGWYYNGNIYQQIAARLAAQPPFATSNTVNTSLADVLTLANGFTTTPAGKTVLNTFAVDPNYRIGYAQTWNVAIQQDLGRGLVFEIGYLGTKGTRLDTQRMPNRAAPGSPLTAEERRQIGDATGFTYESSEGDSIYHALQVRLMRRFRRGISFQAFYTFGKSIDDSSTFGGAGNTVAQNDKDLAAERGLSSFDRRHTFTMNFVLTSPVAAANSNLLAAHTWLTRLLRDWTLSGGVTAETGTPLTARVLGNLSDSSGTGSVGSGRADATGLPIASDAGFFNVAAFTAPPAGQFGNAGRNTIPGPGLFSLNSSFGRSFSLGERRRLEFRVDSNNVLNHASFTNVGTVVNSLTYGLPTAASAMRSMAATLRFRF